MFHFNSIKKMSAMQPNQWILFIILVLSFHGTLSLSSVEEISGSECVRETVKFNVNVSVFTKAALGLGRCDCKSFCSDLFENVESYIHNRYVFFWFQNSSSILIIRPNLLIHFHCAMIQTISSSYLQMARIRI